MDDHSRPFESWNGEMVSRARMIPPIFKRKLVWLLPFLLLALAMINYSFTLRKKTKPVEHLEQMVVPIKSAKVKVTPAVVVAPLPRDIDLHHETKQEKADLDDVYRKRRETVKNICKKMEIEPMSTQELSTQVWHTKAPLSGITLCPVPQTSSVWKKTLEIWIRSKTETRSSFVLDENRFRNAKSQFVPKDWNAKAAEQFNALLNNSLKVVFTRDPYMQIFSYYVDNILVPNKDSLETNKKIIAKTKKSPSESELACGHNVTFLEFSQYLLYSSLKTEIVGSFSHCDVCGLDYDVIGREDTIDQDVLYVYNKIKSEDKFSSIEDFAQERDYSRLEGYVMAAFTRKNDVPCLSAHVMYRRLWRQLQIWGFIGKTLSFPYSSKESKTLEYETILNAVLTAYNKSVPGSRSNQHEALAQAYSAHSSRDLHKLRDTYLPDFYLFGYRDRPAALFFKQGPTYDFQYFDLVPVRE